MRPVLDYSIEEVSPDPSASQWQPKYPNPPDLAFNYYNLLDVARENGNGIAKAPSGTAPTVAIVGGGVAGLTAARELLRCGYTPKIFEATNRVGGRHYTVHNSGDSITDMEMGAMRFPFFGAPGSKNCVLDYYLTSEANCATEAFPNPGAAPGGTGIYVNRGFGPKDEFSSPTLISWPKSERAPNPPQDPNLKVVYTKVTNFVGFFSGIVGKLYVDADNWPSTWQKISNNYEQLTVSDLVYTPATSTYNDDGWFGGFGMDDQEAQLFALIGSGDGSWGAFYEVSAMWFIRCVMFGFNSNLQSVVGILDKSGLPYYGETVHDSNGTQYPGPLYRGIQTLSEWLLYQKAPGAGQSLYDAAIDSSEGTALFVKTVVRKITKQGNKIQIDYDLDGEVKTITVDYAILTPTLWSSQVGIELSGFDNKNDFPDEVISARNSQHNITSCKVFYRLKENFWENPDVKIPQILVTDDFAQDGYGVSWNGTTGVYLVSYTWEDDAVKILPEDDKDLADLMVTKLDEITGSTVGQKLSAYLDMDSGPTIIHWSKQPSYRGCAKLYRQRNWALNYALISYNQTLSKNSGVYLAGENYGVEGGWTEPALRLAIDAVINLVRNDGGTFNNGFSPSDNYPSYDTEFVPENVYPSPNFRSES